MLLMEAPPTMFYIAIARNRVIINGKYKYIYNNVTFL